MEFSAHAGVRKACEDLLAGLGRGGPGATGDRHGDLHVAPKRHRAWGGACASAERYLNSEIRAAINSVDALNYFSDPSAINSVLLRKEPLRMPVGPGRSDLRRSRPAQLVPESAPVWRMRGQLS